MDNRQNQKPFRILRRSFRIFLYTLGGLLLAWIIAVQSGCMTMRTPDGAWAEKMRAKGQAAVPEFMDVPSPNGRAIHAVVLRAGEQLPWVALLHGSPGSADNYLDYLADTLLSRRANLLSIDRAGFGYSDYGKPEIALDRQALDLKAVLDRVAPAQKVILVGHSMGGPVICRFAMDFPEQTAGLVNVAGSVDPDLEPHPWWQKAIDVPPLCWLLPASFWASNHEIKYLESELRRMLPLWGAIRCPVEIVHADDDRLVPVGNADFCQKMLVNAAQVHQTRLKTGDHFILWSRRDLVRQAVERLLAH